MTRVGPSPTVYFDPSLRSRLAEQVRDGQPDAPKQVLAKRAARAEENEPLVQALMERLQLSNHLWVDRISLLPEQLYLCSEGFRTRKNEVPLPTLVAENRAEVRRGIREAAVCVPHRLGYDPNVPRGLVRDCAGFISDGRPAELTPPALPQSDSLAPYEEVLLRAVRKQNEVLRRLNDERATHERNEQAVTAVVEFVFGVIRLFEASWKRCAHRARVSRSTRCGCRGWVSTPIGG